MASAVTATGTGTGTIVTDALAVEVVRAGAEVVPSHRRATAVAASSAKTRG